MPTPTGTALQQTESALKAIDIDPLHSAYWEQHECVVLERLLPPPLVEHLALEAERVRPFVNRNYVPRHKKGGSVSAYVLRQEAPETMALYHSEIFRRFLSRLTEATLLLCPDQDPHAFALYYYTEPGDHIGFHYDTSYYKGARYTVLVGLVERSTHCRLVARLYKGSRNREIREVRIPMDPGTVVVFNGDKLWHAVTPLGEQEERIVLTLQYVTNREMGLLKRMFSNLKDAFAYFGPAALLRRPPAHKA
ncbi:MAG: 2OG-Fe(II) oxygenase [Nitrospira sp.]|nr:MAG: 2OG-Fe(II) oxygenase [Nitrospira sp.]